MSAAARAVSLVVMSGVLVHFAARSLRWWLALCLAGVSVVFLLPSPWPWPGAAMALCGVVGLTRASVALLRRPASYCGGSTAV